MTDTMKKAAFVLVPGGFSTAGVFDKAEQLFQEQGYPVHTISLPSVGKRPQGPATLQEDAEHIRLKVRAFADAGHDVVLVGNSYGGWIINEAAKGIGKAEGGGLVHIVYLASPFPPRAGISVLDLLEGKSAVPEGTDDEGYVHPPPAEAAGAMLAPSVSKEEQVRYGSMLRHFSERVHTDKLTYLGYEHVPSTAVMTLNDKVVPLEWQKTSYEEAIQRGKGTLRKVEIPGDHCCQISHPKETVQICIEASSL